MNYPTLTTDSSTDALIPEATQLEILSVSSTFDPNSRALVFGGARRFCEEYTGRSFLEQYWTYKLEGWPKGETIYLPKGKTREITVFTYLNAEGDSTTLTENTDFLFESDDDEGKIIPIGSWPSIASDKLGPISITFQSGYGTAANDVPDALKWAVCTKARADFDPEMRGDTSFLSYLKPFVHHFDYTRNEC